MNLLKKFGILLLLVSCQGRISVNSDKAYDRYDRLTGFYAGSAEYSESGIVSQFIINNLNKTNGLLELIPSLEAGDGVVVEPDMHIVSRFYPLRSRRMMFLTPYRPVVSSADKEFRIEARRVAFNVALMLELAEILSRNEPQQFGVDFVFLSTSNRANNKNFSSSAYREFKENYHRPDPELAFLLRLSPGEEVRIPIDYNSYQKSPDAVYDVWSRAYSRGWPEFDDSIEERPLDAGEDILYEVFNLVKLENRIYNVQDPEIQQIKANFRRLITLLMEIIDERG